MIDVVWDMETADPDDCISLLLLLGHPRVNLKAITITPGAPDQIGLVNHIVKDIFQKNIPIGSYNSNYEKNCVSKWHNKEFNFTPSVNAFDGPELLKEYCDSNTILITGAPLKNLGKAINLDNFKLKSLFSQGGFAGEGVVPQELQLEKFKGKVTCPTYNLNGAKQEALNIIKTDLIKEKHFISKNVCHGVFYNIEMHNIFETVKNNSLSLFYIFKVMDTYLQKKPKGKKFHDPLAVCCAIDNSIGVWKNVDLYFEKGEWGSKLNEKSNIEIIINYYHDKFVKTLIEY